MMTVDELHDHARTYEPHTTVRVSYAIASSITWLQLTKLQLDPLNNVALQCLCGHHWLRDRFGSRWHKQ